MAKHIVKCAICGEQFDANILPFVKVNSRRYAHLECSKNAEDKKTQEEKDKENLEKYIMKLFGDDYITPRIRKQINDYIQKYNYTYSGIQRTLEYFFEIKGNSIDKANHGIGIVPYIYQDSYNYFYNLWLAKEKNKNKDIQDFIPTVIEIKIPVPQRKVKKHRKFAFLDKEEEV